MPRFIILLLVASLIFACGYTTGTIQKAEKSFIVFSGNLENVKIHIDELEPFTPSNGIHYEMAPGKHTLFAYREGKLLLNRIIILENQVTTEIKVP
jgi:energy-converting hydrogenase Eha subunit G